ncbi:hypothetical protein PR202_ga22253 [Eleusine coracana subsp. coracana]|uniref:Uncharacterized protein n=1 Tax=Eleusine coracana subsp. coracana TaxID=191504 RepID=A0AAV5D332_ELECO|nr:hypothetical protein PR202_ga22253 [Eleusine coracana subsp. coracana]
MENASSTSSCVVEIEAKMMEYSMVEAEVIPQHSMRSKERYMGLRAEDKAGPSSWVLEMEKMLEDTNPSVETLHWKKACIYRVPKWLKDITNNKAYMPKMVSLGPFHHGDAELMPMEEHKRRATLRLVKRSGKPLREFIAAVEKVADDLDDAYSDLGEEWRGANRARFVEMMVMDGCFLLEIVRACERIIKTGPLMDYAPNDPVFSMHGILSSVTIIRSDMLAMENQLPLLALQRLLAVQKGVSPLHVDHEQSSRTINNMVSDFLDQPYVEGDYGLCLHPLDVLHRGICGRHANGKKQQECVHTMPCAVELGEAGIHFKLSKTECIRDVDFQNGVLSMPLVSVSEASENKLFNLMAFERLHNCAGRDVIDYVVFMDSMIDSGADVALLRSKGLIKHLLGSDEAVARMFNNMTKGAIMSPFSKLHDVQRQVNAHCKKPWNKWRANFVQTYLNNPWVFISLLAAAILVVATLMQTFYTAITFHRKN